MRERYQLLAPLLCVLVLIGCQTRESAAEKECRDGEVRLASCEAQDCACHGGVWHCNLGICDSGLGGNGGQGGDSSVEESTSDDPLTAAED